MCWLLDDSKFESANDSTSVPIGKLRKCLSLAEDLWLYMGTVSGGSDGRRYIPVHDLCSSLSNITCQILPSLDVLTGCDTTSAFFRIGKKYLYKILKTSPE